MADTIVSKSKIDAIADAVNTKTGKTGAMTLDEIAQAVKDYDPGQGVTMTQICDGSAYEGDIVIDTVYHSADEKTICVPDHRFRGTGMNSVTINEPSGFYIGGYSFNKCTNLTKVDAPNCVKVSGYSFIGCTSLSNINLPKLQTIGSYAFQETGIKKLEITTLNTLEGSAFSGCQSLTTVNAPNLSTVGSSSFYNCKSLSGLTCPTLLSVGSSCFTNCFALEEFIAAVNSVGASAFSVCSNLKIFDSTSTTAGKFSGSYTFQNTSKLDAVILRSNGVWSNSASTTFTNSKIGAKGGFIYVPKDLIDSYKVATNWAAYADYFRALEDYTTDGTTTGPLDSSKI
jgi:hypothetical protein